MAIDYLSVLPNLISSFIGLLGVALGGWIANSAAERKEKKRLVSESSYLAVLVLAHLDRFINSCLSVSFDDGTSNGRPANGDYHEITIDAPMFDPLALAVDWKVLPKNFMYDILSIPHKTEQIERNLTALAEFAEPPDFTDYFWSRQQDYAALGIEVFVIAKNLREYAGLPSEASSRYGSDCVELMQTQIDSIFKKREALQISRSAFSNASSTI